MPSLAFNACLQGMQINILCNTVLPGRGKECIIVYNSDELSKRTLGAAGHSPESLGQCYPSKQNILSSMLVEDHL